MPASPKLIWCLTKTEKDVRQVFCGECVAIEARPTYVVGQCEGEVEGAEAREEELALGDLGRSRINQPVDALLHLGYLQLLKVLLGCPLHITTRVTSMLP